VSSGLQHAYGSGRRPRELLYHELTDDDERIRRDVRYRTGRRLGGTAIAVVLFVAIGFPVAFVLDWRDGGSDTLSLLPAALLVLFWVLSLFGVYAWWFYRRQDWSELRRAYRFRRVEPEDDAEIAGAKGVLLDSASSPSQREQAIQILLSRGACTPNKVSIARDVLALLATFAIVMLVLFLLVWLF
jgi:hypothetical protein